jgi:hypothetical protein
MALPSDLEPRHFPRLPRPGRAPLLDEHYVVAIEHSRAAFALKAVILAVPGVGLAGLQIVSFAAGEAAICHAHDQECARLAVECVAALPGRRLATDMPRIPVPAGDSLAIGATEVWQLVEVMNATLDQQSVPQLVPKHRPGAALPVVRDIAIPTATLDRWKSSARSSPMRFEKSSGPVGVGQ